MVYGDTCPFLNLVGDSKNPRFAFAARFLILYYPICTLYAGADPAPRVPPKGSTYPTLRYPTAIYAPIRVSNAACNRLNFS